MTEGSIWKKIIFFAMPIFLGNLFQQLYNVVDSLVVGNVLGKEALAAVTSTGSLIFLIIGFLGGLFVGAGVIISRYFGAGNEEKLKVAIHTTMAAAIIAGIFVTVFGMLLTPLFLRWTGTPDDVFHEATVYLRLYFAGGLFMVLYNACVGIFQAVGDSRHPLYYLVTAAITNIILDILFVAYFGMGVAGAAIATGISQLLSAFLAFRKLTTTGEFYRLEISKIRINIPMLKRLVSMGLPSGIQNSVVAFANVIVQANINTFGSVHMAGNGSYTKLEGFAFLPIISFSMALTTFVGQNMGAQKFDRVRKGARFGLLTGTVLAEIIGVILWFYSPTLIAFFNSQPDVVSSGTDRARIICLFYFLLALSHLLSGILRGLGKTQVPMYVMLISWCVIRITYIIIMVRYIPDIRVVYWAYPITWLISTAAFILYYFKTGGLNNLDKIKMA